MKKTYRFSSGEIIQADRQELLALLEQYRQYRQNYVDLFGSLEDADYVARGNGFCDTKYSEDFVEGQIEKYCQRIREMEHWLAQDL
ncbi:MAG: hypothetical protein K5846_06820 [Bacteroidales bacterium]|nr:hypothetical protein [Bacteroidales bacterium]